MTARLQVFVGMLTAAVFIALGASLWSEEQPLIGGVLLSLGLLRAGVLVMQIRALLASDAPERGGEDVD